MAEVLRCLGRSASVAVAMLVAMELRAQELEPRAYAAAPVGLNLFSTSVTNNAGDLSFEPSVPIEEAEADINTVTVGYNRFFGLAGRSASAGFGLPYVRGDLDGLVLGEPRSAYRSGLGDPRMRLSVNLHGVPAMSPKEFAGYQQKTNVGASLTVGLPLGQYDPVRLINIGTNRWSFKPEVGVSHAMGKWTLEGYAGVWLFTRNSDFYQGGVRDQDPIGSFQAHVIYNFRPGLWLGFNSNYYNGGRTTLNGKQNFDLQQNSRMGLTLAVPVKRVHTVKIAFSRGARTTIGGDFTSIGISYTYVWR